MVYYCNKCDKHHADGYKKHLPFKESSEITDLEDTIGKLVETVQNLQGQLDYVSSVVKKFEIWHRHHDSYWTHEDSEEARNNL